MITLGGRGETGTVPLACRDVRQRVAVICALMELVDSDHYVQQVAQYVSHVD